jgi:predicted Zn-dependent protease
MIPTLGFRNICLTAGAVGLAVITCGLGLKAQEILQDVETIIMEGNVVMPDGTPPPRSVGVERVCSDANGSAPGPITDKKGHYTWTQKLTPGVQRACFMQATLTGFSSTRFDLGSMKLADFTAGTKKLQIPDLVLSPKDSGAANYVALVSLSDVPGKARDAYKLASKALDADNAAEGMRQLKAVVAAAPKFADGWNNLGSVYERQGMLMDAKDALQHAIEANPKAPAPYLRMARVANKLGDWDTAAKSEDALLAIDKRFYPEVYLHQAITRFEKKDLAGAEESIKTLQGMDEAHKQYRAEYVEGRIALAKGDVPSAKEHIANYIRLDAAAPDLPKIQALLATLGTGTASQTSLPLERP